MICRPVWPLRPLAQTLCWCWASLIVLAAGCQKEPVIHPSHASHTAGTVKSTYRGKHPIAVVCTTGMVADVVSQVGGPRVSVAQLMKDGTDPHLYKATTHDVDRL